MFEVNVSVNAPALAEALNNLASAISGKAIVSAEAVAETPNANPTAPVATPVQIPDTAAAPANVPQSVPSAPLPTNVTTPSSVPTIDELSRAGAALCEQGKMPALIDLLGRYGIVAVTQLNSAAPDVLFSFANDLRALGANI